MAQLKYPDEGAAPPALQASARAAIGVICPSQFAADEVTEVLGVRRCWVATAGVDNRFRDPPPLTAEQRAALGVPGPYVLHAGGSTLRKTSPRWPRHGRRCTPHNPTSRCC